MRRRRTATVAGDHYTFVPNPTWVINVLAAFGSWTERQSSPYAGRDGTELGLPASFVGLLDVKTLAQYTDWMKGIMTVLPDAHYEVKSFATDTVRNNVAGYGVFHGTHTGEGGPVPPTGRRISTDYVYVMQFEDSKIVHMTKIWNAGLALKDLGWA